MIKSVLSYSVLFLLNILLWSALFWFIARPLAEEIPLIPNIPIEFYL